MDRSNRCHKSGAVIQAVGQTVVTFVESASKSVKPVKPTTPNKKTADYGGIQADLTS
jgi:S-adenosylmethionine:tRNA-ribosyltransferase-isomerase (queuine synthetase)